MKSYYRSFTSASRDTSWAFQYPIRRLIEGSLEIYSNCEIGVSKYRIAFTSAGRLGSSAIEMCVIFWCDRTIVQHTNLPASRLCVHSLLWLIYACMFQIKHPHYSDVIISEMTTQIIGVSMVCSTVCSGEDQRKHQSSASLAFVKGIHRWSVNPPHKGPVTW